MATAVDKKFNSTWKVLNFHPINWNCLRQAFSNFKNRVFDSICPFILDSDPRMMSCQILVSIWHPRGQIGSRYLHFSTPLKRKPRFSVPISVYGKGSTSGVVLLAFSQLETHSSACWIYFFLERSLFSISSWIPVFSILVMFRNRKPYFEICWKQHLIRNTLTFFSIYFRCWNPVASWVWRCAARSCLPRQFLSRLQRLLQQMLTSGSCVRLIRGWIGMEGRFRHPRSMSVRLLRLLWRLGTVMHPGVRRRVLLERYAVCRKLCNPSSSPAFFRDFHLIIFWAWWPLSHYFPILRFSC